MAGPSRRGLVLGAPLALAACGFHPLYGTGTTGPVRPELASIYVTLLPERNGQLLRQALQQRLEGTGSGTAKRYELSAGFVIVGEGIAIRPDGTSTRSRLIGNASWTLYALSPTRTAVTSGNARAVDGLSVVNAQYLAADLETEVASRRVADAVADQITQRLAAFFDQAHAQARAQAPAKG